MKKSFHAGEWLRRSLGVLVLAGVVAIAFGVDTGFLARLSLANTTRFEEGLIGMLTPPRSARPIQHVAGSTLPIEGAMPELSGAVAWLNSPPLTRSALHGKVVLVDFWTYSCINCLRSLPYVEAWARKYENHGLVVIGVHSPEFAFEKELANVEGAVKSLGVTYPVAVDSHLAIWQAFNNEYWPADYLIDAEGRIRAHHFGEGDYDGSEREIQTLLKEAGYKNVPTGIVNPNLAGTFAAADDADMQSPETYLGYGRGENFASGEPKPDQAWNYQTPYPLSANQWGLTGRWTIGEQKDVLDRPGGKITFFFHARDLHLVLGPGTGGKPIRFKVTLDGKPPGDAHGVDDDADGNGEVTGERLYQLIRQRDGVGSHTFRIEFLDSGVEAYSFTFG